MQYSNSNRGEIQFRERFGQAINFSGMKFGSITPTDVDAFFEIRGEIFVFYEVKMAGSRMPYGQELALTRLIDALDAAGKHAVLFVGWHNVRNPALDVFMANTVLHQLYWRGSWRPGRVMGRVTLKQATDRFIHWAQWTEAMRNRNASCGVA